MTGVQTCALPILNQKININHSHFLDLHFEDVAYHGNYQSTRAVNKVIKYITKDGNYYTNDEEKLKISEKTKGISTAVATAILEGKDNQALIEDFPGFLLLNHHKINSFRAFLDSASFTSQPWPRINLDPLPHEASVLWWLGVNLFSERCLRQDQLYIWGLPGCNKTSTVELIMNSLKAFVPS